MFFSTRYLRAKKNRERRESAALRAPPPPRINRAPIPPPRINYPNINVVKKQLNFWQVPLNRRQAITNKAIKMFNNARKSYFVVKPNGIYRRGKFMNTKETANMASNRRWNESRSLAKFATQAAREPWRNNKGVLRI